MPATRTQARALSPHPETGGDATAAGRVGEAKVVIEDWRLDYNTTEPPAATSSPDRAEAIDDTFAPAKHTNSIHAHALRRDYRAVIRPRLIPEARALRPL